MVGKLMGVMRGVKGVEGLECAAPKPDKIGINDIHLEMFYFYLNSFKI